MDATEFKIFVDNIDSVKLKTNDIIIIQLGTKMPLTACKRMMEDLSSTLNHQVILVPPNTIDKLIVVGNDKISINDLKL